MINHNFMPDLRVLQLRPILCLFLSYFGENDLTCIATLRQSGATVVLDVATNFVASDGNKHSEAINRRWPHKVYRRSLYATRIHLCLLQTYVILQSARARV